MLTTSISYGLDIGHRGSTKVSEAQLHHSLQLLSWMLGLPQLKEIRGELQAAQERLQSGAAVGVSTALGDAHNQLFALLPLSLGQKILSLAHETSPGLFGEGLAELATYFEKQGDSSAAGQLLLLASQVLEDLPNFESSYEQVKHRLTVINGGGGLSDQVAMFVRSMPHELKNGGMLAGMMAAGVVSPLATGFVGRMIGNSLGQGSKLVLSRLGGIAADGLAFETAHRGVDILQGKTVQPFAESLGHAYWMIASLRFTGLLGRTLSQSQKFSRVVNGIARYQAQRVHQGMHTLFEYGGIYLSQTQGHFVGLEQGQAPYAWMQSLFTLCHFKMAGASLQALAPGFAAFTHRLQMETAKIFHKTASGVRERFSEGWKIAADGAFLHKPSLAVSGNLGGKAPSLKADSLDLKDLYQAHMADAGKDTGFSGDVSNVGKAFNDLYPYLPDSTRGTPVTHLELRPPTTPRRHLANVVGFDPKAQEVKLSLVQGSDNSRTRLQTGASIKIPVGNLNANISPPEAMTTWIPPIVEPELHWLDSHFQARVPWLNWQILRFSELHLPQEERQILDPHRFAQGLPQLDVNVLPILENTRQLLLYPSRFSNWLVELTYAVLKRMGDAGENVSHPAILTGYKYHSKLTKYLDAEVIERGREVGFKGNYEILYDISREEFLGQVAAGNLIFDKFFAANLIHGRPPHALGAVYLGEQIENYIELYREEGRYSMGMSPGSKDLWVLGKDDIRSRTYFRHPGHLYYSLLILMPALHPVIVPHLVNYGSY